MSGPWQIERERLAAEKEQKKWERAVKFAKIVSFLRAQNATMRAALKSFAAHGEYIDKEFPDDADDTVAAGHKESFMTLGDFRRARAAYEGSGK